MQGGAQGGLGWGREGTWRRSELWVVADAVSPHDLGCDGAAGGGRPWGQPWGQPAPPAGPSVCAPERHPRVRASEAPAAPGPSGGALRGQGGPAGSGDADVPGGPRQTRARSEGPLRVRRAALAGGGCGAVGTAPSRWAAGRACAVHSRLLLCGGNICRRGVLVSRPRLPSAGSGTEIRSRWVLYLVNLVRRQSS